MNLFIVKNSITRLLKICSQLTSYTGRPFTLDGHAVGSIGEVYARECYMVRLHRPCYPNDDAVWNGHSVQIKATQGQSVELRGISDYLLVFRINRDGTCEEIYNGDGKIPWRSLDGRKKTKTGHVSIQFTKLKALNLQSNKRILLKRYKSLIKRGT